MLVSIKYPKKLKKIINTGQRYWYTPDKIDTNLFKKNYYKYQTPDAGVIDFKNQHLNQDTINEQQYDYIVILLFLLFIFNLNTIDILTSISYHKMKHIYNVFEYQKYNKKKTIFSIFKKIHNYFSKNSFKKNNKYIKIHGYVQKIKKIKKITKKKNLTNVNNMLQKTKDFYVTEKTHLILSNIFYRLFKKKINIINTNYYHLVRINKFKKYINFILFKFSFFKKTIIVYKIIKIIAASLIYKDSKVLIHVLKEVFESVHYSKHRIYFLFWKYIIMGFFSKYYKKLNVKGVMLEFHGKLGVGGNSKKRSYYFKMGQCSNSNKELKIDSTNSFIWTHTGSVGFTYSIYY